MRSRLVAGSLLALSTTGCLATKGDIRQLQEELRATRASVARSDSAHRQTSDSLAAALARLASLQSRTTRDALAAQQKSTDELRALAARVAGNDIAAKEQLKALSDDVDQLRENVRQNTRSQTLTRAQLEQARPPAPTLPSDSAAPAAPVMPGPPGAATLLVQGRNLVYQGSCATGRRTFQDLLAQFPESPEAAEAQYFIAESYVACAEGANPARADSVYRIVTEKYPRSDFAAISLYKRAEAQRLAGKPDAAKPLYERIVCEYRTSTVLAQALNRLGGARPACR